MSKYTFYGICLQLILGGVLIASSTEAQRQSLDKIFVSIDIDNLRLSEALQKLSEETDFNFSYNDLRINEDKVISASVSNKSMTTLLKRISKDYDLKFKRINENIYVSKKEKNGADVEEQIFGSFQEREISGRVTSSEDNSGLPGVSVLIQGSTTGTITDIDGNYVLSVPDGAILEFSSVGFNKEIIEVGNRTVIDLSMMPDVTQLSEIVVIGYGTRKKKDLTGAISVMNEEEIKQSNAMAPELAMQGRMPGVLVTTPSGNPQDRPNVQIRGIGTFNVADPLYVIDGIPVTEFGSGWEGAGTTGSAARNRDIRGPVNVLTLVNPQDIESISVLKDASASAIYGVRAANGVILITTKKGYQGRAKVDFDMKYGISNINRTYDLLGVADYTALYQEAHFNNPGQLVNMPAVFNPSDTLARGPYDAYLGDKPTVDWQTPMINKNAALYDVSAKVYGGTETVDYFLSTGYSSQEGPMISNYMDRYSFAGNVNAKAGKHVEAGATFRTTYIETRDQSPELTNGVSAPPWQPIYYEDDYYGAQTPQGALYGYATTIDSTLTPNPNHPNWGGDGDPDETPIYNMDVAVKYGTETETQQFAFADSRMRSDDYEYLRNMGNAWVGVRFLDGFMLKGSYSVDWFYQRRNSWSSINSVMYSITPGNPWDEGDRTGSTKGSYSERHNRNYNMVGEILLNYNKTFGDHNIDVTLNFSDQRYGYDIATAGSSQINVDDPEKRWVPDASGAIFNGGFTGKDRFALQGYMARASYNFASKYYLDATVRRDGSSRFAPGYQWGTFPSFAAAWRISSESFMSGINLINDLKIRAGWGQLGNQETRPFAYLSTVRDEPAYSYGSGLGDGAGSTVYGVRLPDFPTEDLSWETTTTTNAGFDAILFKNKLNFTFEYYNRKTEDILQQAGISPSVGNELDPILNIATVRNQGVELQLGWSDNIGDVNYFVNGNFTTVNNEVLEIWRDTPFFGLVGGGGGINQGQQLRIAPGYPMYHIWGFQTAGIFQSEDEITAYQEVYTDNQGDATQVSPGDFWFKDVHGKPTDDEPFFSTTPDSLVDLNDRTYIGSTIPGHFWGLTLGASWKGFDISAFLQGIGDIQAYNSELAKGVSMSSTGINQWTNTLNRWTPSNPNQWNPNDKANSLPRAVRNDPANNNRFSDRFVEDAGFMRLRNLTLGYSVPASVLGKVDWIERFRIYVMGTNLWTVSKWSGPDPENSNNPIPVGWTFGLNATF